MTAELLISLTAVYHIAPPCKRVQLKLRKFLDWKFLLWDFVWALPTKLPFELKGVWKPFKVPEIPSLSTKEYEMYRKDKIINSQNLMSTFGWTVQKAVFAYYISLHILKVLHIVKVILNLLWALLSFGTEVQSTRVQLVPKSGKVPWWIIWMQPIWTSNQNKICQFGTRQVNCANCALEIVLS